jgi:hypothetical protein
MVELQRGHTAVVATHSAAATCLEDKYPFESPAPIRHSLLAQRTQR